VRLFELGLAQGDERVRALCAGTLGRSAEVPARPASRGAAPYRVAGREGVRLAQKAEVERLRLAPPALFVDLPRQRLVSARGAVSLAGRRVMLPLLLAFLEKPDRALDAEQLHREIWGTDRFDDASRTRLKVALSRLRELLGPGVIETRRTTDATGATRAVFALSPKVPYLLIDRS
jgi:DNA-binding response OmpR family regulator